MIKFIDISNWQRGIDLMSVVRNGDLSAVVVKATEGTGLVDKSCDGFVQTCIANGIPFGFYHFARNANPRTEAEYFRKHTRGYEGKGIPILDWEDGQSIDWVNTFVSHYHDLTGVWPWVYGNAWRFNQGTVNTNCGRWIAGYPSNGIRDINYGMRNNMPYKVNNGLVCAWQFSSSVCINGYGASLDGDVFYGDVNAWNAYAHAAPVNNPTADVTQLAYAVIRGDYGNGQTRRDALGANYDVVQDRVNELMTHPDATVIDILAKQVINGDYGNGQTRRDALGSNYDAVQARVNELLY